MLAAGLKGIEEEYPAPPPVEGNVAMMSNAEREARGIKSLPTSLGQALALAEESDLLHDALGDHIFHSFIRNKRMEWEEYRATVTDYEISRVLAGRCKQGESGSRAIGIPGQRWCSDGRVRGISQESPIAQSLPTRRLFKTTSRSAMPADPGISGSRPSSMLLLNSRTIGT